MRHAVVRTPRRPTRGGVREDGALPDHSATRPCGMCRRTWAIRRDGPGSLDGADRLGHWEFLAGCPWSDVVRVQRDVTGRGNASAPSGGPGLGRRRATRQVECRAPSAGGTEGAECHLERMDRMLAIAPEPGSARALAHPDRARAGRRPTRCRRGQAPTGPVEQSDVSRGTRWTGHGCRFMRRTDRSAAMCAVAARRCGWPAYGTRTPLVGSDVRPGRVEGRWTGRRTARRLGGSARVVGPDVGVHCQQASGERPPASGHRRAATGEGERRGRAAIASGQRRLAGGVARWRR